ncbi:MAG: FRG domain-containing protein [Proteobacteria bacterium]|nr:FRG domain-containing protein [Pseudomonadota bacterium]
MTDIQNQEINNLSDLIKLLDIQKFEEGAPRYYYRGESNIKRPLLPQLARNLTLLGKNEVFSLISNKQTQETDDSDSTFFDLQSRLLQKLRRYAVHLYRQNNRPWQGEEPSDWEWLCVAQHHGLPTLLSDWTINPLVALFFSALRDESDGIFYSMKLKAKKDREGETIRVGQNEDKSSFNKPDLQLKKIDKAVIVVPLVFTRRIETQSARFVYFGHLSKEKIPSRDQLIDSVRAQKEFYCEKAIDILSEAQFFHSPNPWEEIISYKIPKISKQKILTQLRNAQIHHGTLFPDLDGYSQYLRMGGI